MEVQVRKCQCLTSKKIPCTKNAIVGDFCVQHAKMGCKQRIQAQKLQPSEKTPTEEIVELPYPLVDTLSDSEIVMLCQSMIDRREYKQVATLIRTNKHIKNLCQSMLTAVKPVDQKQVSDLRERMYVANETESSKLKRYLELVTEACEKKSIPSENMMIQTFGTELNQQLNDLHLRGLSHKYNGYKVLGAKITTQREFQQLEAEILELLDIWSIKEHFIDEQIRLVEKWLKEHHKRVIPSNLLQDLLQKITQNHNEKEKEKEDQYRLYNDGEIVHVITQESKIPALHYQFDWELPIHVDENDITTSTATTKSYAIMDWDHALRFRDQMEVIAEQFDKNNPRPREINFRF